MLIEDGGSMCRKSRRPTLNHSVSEFQILDSKLSDKITLKSFRSLSPLDFSAGKKV